MTATSLDPSHALRDALPPGLYIETGVRRGDSAPPELMTGVPAFIGFGTVNDAGLQDRAGSPGIVLVRWNERLWGSGIAEAPGSFLRASVRGFFANGGQRCVVFVLPPTSRGEAAAAQLRLLDRGGPLDDRSDIDLVCLPDAAAMLSDTPALRDVYAAALRHCDALGDRFALLDAPPPGARTTSGGAVDAWLELARDLRSGFGALYGPWISPVPVRDADERPATGSEEWRDPGPRSSTGAAAARMVPPSGYVAGVIARVDRRVGAQRAPANERLDGVFDTAVHLDIGERGRLNAGGVNCIQGAGSRGIRLVGARTLSTRAASTHVSGVRVVLGFRRWVAVRMRDLVFETHSTRLWDVIASRLVAHCLEMQRAGALAGSRPDDAFFVKCDAETNPPEERELGRVVALVGLAPSRPAEFIVIRVIRDASGFTVGGLS